MSSAKKAQVLVTREDGVGIITLDVAAAGAAPGPTLIEALQQLNADTECRSIVLASAATGFCPAGDLFPALNGASGDIFAARRRVQEDVTLFRDLLRGPKPVIAAVEGQVAGIGLSLAAACDHVVAANNASFSGDLLGQGDFPAAGLLWTLQQKIGAGKTREFLMTGGSMNAEEGLRLGLVSELAAPGEALKAALALAKRYEALPLVAVALLKASFVNGTRSIEECVRVEMDLNPLVRLAKDHTEAIAAFMEKRKPNFIGN